MLRTLKRFRRYSGNPPSKESLLARFHFINSLEFFSKRRSTVFSPHWRMKFCMFLSTNLPTLSSLRVPDFRVGITLVHILYLFIQYSIQLRRIILQLELVSKGLSKTTFKCNVKTMPSSSQKLAEISYFTLRQASTQVLFQLL